MSNIAIPFNFSDCTHGFFASDVLLTPRSAGNTRSIHYNRIVERLIGLGPENLHRKSHNDFFQQLAECLPGSCGPLVDLFMPDGPLDRLLRGQGPLKDFEDAVTDLGGRNLECAVEDTYAGAGPAPVSRPTPVRYHGVGPVIVDTRSTTSVSPQSCTTFRLTAYAGRVMELTSRKMEPDSPGPFKLLCEIELTIRMGSGNYVESIQGQLLDSKLVISKYTDYATISDSIGHLFKAALNLMGAPRAMLALRNLERNANGLSPQQLSQIRMAARSLSLHAAVRSLGELMRAASLCRKGDYSLLQTWYNKSSLNDWRNKLPSVVNNYRRIIKWYIASVCFARGLQEFSWEDCDTGEIVKVNVDEAASAMVEDMLSGTSGRLAPFTLSHGLESHLTLLGALLEPAVNAVHYLTTKSAVGFTPRLFIRFDPRLPDHVCVAIGNTVSDATVFEESPPGIDKSAKLLFELGIARYGKPKEFTASTTDDGDHVFWVHVYLEPQNLVERIGALR